MNLWERLSTRDKRAIALLLASAVVALTIAYWPEANNEVTATVNDVPQAERRVTRLRRLAQAVPGRLEVQKKLSAELADREKKLIRAETAAQAQEQLVQIIRRVAKQQQPPLEFRGTELGPPKPFGDSYGEVSTTLSFEGGIEQIVNLLADIANQPEAIATSEVQMGSGSGRQKMIPVRLTVTGLVPRKLVPQKKELAF